MLRFKKSLGTKEVARTHDSAAKRLAHPLQRVTRVSVTSQVVNAVREGIFSGNLKPGEKLVERRLAQEMGVSLGSVREALLKLGEEGLVTKKADSATHVTKLTVENLREVLDLRILLEERAMVLASRQFTSADRKQLDSLADEIARCALDGDIYGLSQVDLRFHQSIWEIAGNRTLTKILSQLTYPLFAYLTSKETMTHMDMKGRVRSHKALIEALGSQNEEVAAVSIKEHIETSWKIYSFFAPGERHAQTKSVQNTERQQTTWGQATADLSPTSRKSIAET